MVKIPRSTLCVYASRAVVKAQALPLRSRPERLSRRHKVLNLGLLFEQGTIVRNRKVTHRQRKSLVNVYFYFRYNYIGEIEEYIRKNKTSKNDLPAWSPAISLFVGMVMKPVSICRHVGYSRRSCTHVTCVEMLVSLYRILRVERLSSVTFFVIAQRFVWRSL